MFAAWEQSVSSSGLSECAGRAKWEPLKASLVYVLSKIYSKTLRLYFYDNVYTIKLNLVGYVLLLITCFNTFGFSTWRQEAEL